MGAIKRFFSFFRKIQFHILTIFISILAAACLGITWFSYTRNFEASKVLSDTIIRQTNDQVIQRFVSITDESSILVKIASATFKNTYDISLGNMQVIQFLCDLIKYDPLIASINIGLDDGSYLGVHQAAITASQRNVGIDWPPGTVYTVRTVSWKGPKPKEEWKFFDSDMKITGTMINPKPPPDVRTNPWFLSMKDQPGMQWNTSWIPRGIAREKQDPVLVASTPLFNKEKEFRGLIGINTTMMTLSSFVKAQAIGQSGRLFVLDEQGQVVLPLTNDQDTVAIHLKDDVVAPTYTRFQADKKPAQEIKVGGVKYLSYFSDFPVSPSAKWVIAIALPFNDFFGIVAKTQHESLAIAFGVLFVAGTFVLLMAKRISLPIVQLAAEVDKITHFDFVPGPKILAGTDEVALLDDSISRMRGALSSFTKFIPKDIVKALIGQGQEIKLGGERKDLTLMFSDIQDFTTISEETHIYALVTSMEHYFDSIAKTILATQGTIDKYIGDSVMAFWGAPTPLPHPIESACNAALQCHAALNINYHALGLPNWKTRFGIHTGEVIIGNFGTNDRLNYTAIGDTVNTTARIQSMNKQYGTSIMISDAVFDKVGPAYVTRPIDRIVMRGKKNAVTVYELFGTAEGELRPPQEKILLAKSFKEAFTVFHQGKLQEAQPLFAAIAAQYPDDVPTQIYLKRIAQGEHNPQLNLIQPPQPPQTPPQQPPSKTA